MPTLAQARRRKLLTQRQLADELGVSRTLVSAWERGVQHPRPDHLQRLGQVLDITPEAIEFTPRLENSGASRQDRIQERIRAHDESMGYVDSTWLRGGRYDIDPASHEPSP